MQRVALKGVATIGAIVTWAAACAETPVQPLDDGAPAVQAAVAPGGVLPGRFIVTLRADADPVAVAGAHGVAPDFVYRHALVGFAGGMSEAARGGLLRDGRVMRIEPDGIVTTFLTNQTNPTWGLDRIDDRSGLDQSYTYEGDGSGVRAYIIDTGIRTSHTDFGGRAVHGFDAIEGGTADDCNGHGTHVAGTVGGSVYGVAKGVTLVAVRVLDCNGSGTTSGVIAGVDWVTATHVKPAVANMSLGGGASSSLDDAVRNSIAAGVSYAIAAGNGNRGGKEQDACGYSPARVAEAMTISATNSSDTKASWANYGSCVDWFAPGVSITSAWSTSNTATNTISGTSMAAPHAAGVAALYLQTNTGASPATVRNALYDLTTKGVVSSASTTNNHLLYSLVGGGSGGGDDGGSTNNPPTAAFTFNCTDLACSFNGSGSTDSDATLSHTYASAGTRTVRLTVTDNGGETDFEEKSVTVSEPSSGGFLLSASGRKVRGRITVDLTWSGATSTNVDVYRNGSVVATTANDGAHTDDTGLVGGGTFTYKVCHAGTSTCSNNATVTF